MNEEEAPSRLPRNAFENVTSGLFTLLHGGDAKDYVGHLTLLCNNPNQFAIQAHEVSREPGTGIPRVFLSYMENIRRRRDQWTTFDHEVAHRIFDGTRESMEGFGAFTKERIERGWSVLQNYRFYEMGPGTREAHFRMIVIYVKRGEEGEDGPSRKNWNAGAWINWGLLVPAKAAY